MREPHVHHDLRDVGARARAFAEAPLDDRLRALAHLEIRATSSSGATWINLSLAVVSIVTLFGATLVAAYGIWAQGGLAYWTLQAQDINSAGAIHDQPQRWADASANILDTPNTLAEGLTGWGAGLSLALIVVLLVSTISKTLAERSRRTALAWIAVYDRVWPKEGHTEMTSLGRPSQTEQRKARRLSRLFRHL